jgi:prepilin-type N-terminal cleavage/methylation domain-containing protein
MKQNQNGFSLLELTIVLTALALLMSAQLPAISAEIKHVKSHSTTQEMHTIKKALHSFAKNNGRLPCPASITAVRGDTLFGHERTNIVSCSTLPPLSGTWRVRNSLLSGYVRIGAVPVYDLGLSDEYLADEWDGRYLYMVTELAVASTLLSLPLLTGEISILDDTLTPLATTGNWAIISLGASAGGSYVNASGAPNVESCNSSTKEAENCDYASDAVITVAQTNFTDSSGAFYDDTVIWESTSLLAAILP